MDDGKRLEEIMKVIDDLSSISDEETILVEGIRDMDALRSLGISGNITVLNHGKSIVETCELVAESFSAVHILTDWDRKGGILGRMVIEQLKALGVSYSMEERKKISYLCKKYIKDVESLPELIIRLSSGATTYLWR